VKRRSVRPGEVLAGAAGLALLGLLFVDWYGTTIAFGALDRLDLGLTAWEAFSVTDIVLALVAVLAIALAVTNAAGRGPALPVALGVLTSTAGLAATLLVLYRIVNQPGPNDVIEVRTGAWLALAATAAVFFGGWLALSDETPRPVDPPAPEPERRPAPARS
jgi:hypothetical protein